MIRSLIGTLALASAGVCVAGEAFADAPEDAGTDADARSCDGRMSGDACTRSGGSSGTCRPSTPDSKKLTCDDTADRDQAACMGKAAGEECSRSTGLTGVCVADAVVPNKMRCEGSRTRHFECAASTEGTSSPLGALVGLGLAAVCAGRAARRRRSQ